MTAPFTETAEVTIKFNISRTKHDTLDDSKCHAIEYLGELSDLDIKELITIGRWESIDDGD